MHVINLSLSLSYNFNLSISDSENNISYTNEPVKTTQAPKSDFDSCVEIWWLEELRKKYGAVHGYTGLAVCLFGVLSNLANIVVLTRRHMVSSTNLLLCALAVANVVKMSSFVPVYAHFYLALGEVSFFSRSIGWVYYLLVQITVGIMLHTVALYITISIAIFRYLYIRYPIAGVQLCNIQNSIIVILLMTALSALISIPNILCNDIVSIATEVANDSVTEFVGQNTYMMYTISPNESWPMIQAVNMWVQSIFIRFLPCIMLTLFTVLLVIEIRKAKTRRLALKSTTVRRPSMAPSAQKKCDKDSTTTMLLVVVVLFLVVEFPQGVMAVANYISVCFYGKVYMALGDLLDLVTLSNNAVSFIIYTAMSKQFRDSFVAIFWTQWCRREKQLSKMKHNG